MKRLTISIFLCAPLFLKGQSADSLLREGLFYSNTNNKVDYLTFVTPDIKLAHTLDFKKKEKTFYLLDKSNLISDTLHTENFYDRGVVLSGDSMAQLINAGRTGVLKFRNGKFIEDTIIYNKHFSQFIICGQSYIGVRASQVKERKRNSTVKIMGYSLVDESLKEVISVDIPETPLNNKHYPKIYYAIGSENVWLFLASIRTLYRIDKKSLLVKKYEIPKDEKEWYYYFDRVAHEHYLLYKSDAYHVYRLDTSWSLHYLGRISNTVSFPREVTNGKFQITELDDNEVVHRLIKLE